MDDPFAALVAELNQKDDENSKSQQPAAESNDPQSSATDPPSSIPNGPTTSNLSDPTTKTIAPSTTDLPNGSSLPAPINAINSVPSSSITAHHAESKSDAESVAETVITVADSVITDVVTPHHLGGDQSMSMSMSVTIDHSRRPSEAQSIAFPNNFVLNKVTPNGTGGTTAGGDDAEEDDEAAFIETVKAIDSVEELQQKLIDFYKRKEAESYELKSRFTEISRRQKEVFVEVESKRKMAVQKGKKYKQSAQKYHHQAAKTGNELKAERKRVHELSAQLEVTRDQKKQREGAIESLTKTIQTLKSSLSQTEQSKHLILDEFKQTHGVIGRLIENEKIQEKLKCYVEVQGPNGSGGGGGGGGLNSNLSVATLKWLDPEAADRGELTIQWNRSYFTQLIPIKNAHRERYQLSADDVGSIIKVEVRSKDNPDCYETAVLKHGPIRMHSSCIRMAEENLQKIQKQHIEFAVEPDLNDKKTQQLLAPQLQSAKSKTLILHFNKDKVKLRTPRNATIEKAEYNDLMKMALSALNPCRFSLRLSEQRKYVFLSRTPMERDNMAILLRCYIEKLKVERAVNGGFQCYFYLRSSNERTNADILNKSGGGNGDALTRDQLVSKILAPISSNRRVLDSINGAVPGVSPHSITGMLMQPATAPISNDPSMTNETEIDVDSVFPDFHDGSAPKGTPNTLGTAIMPTPTPSASANPDDAEEVSASAPSHKSKGKKAPRSKNKKEVERESETKSGDVEFDDEEMAAAMEMEQQEKAKKVWKNLEFVEEATIASETELKSMAITPAPTSRTGKGKRGKNKKRKKKGTADTAKQTPSGPTAADTPNGSNGTNVVTKGAVEEGQSVEEERKEGMALTEEIHDRIDCHLNASGEILKYQVVGDLTLKYRNGGGGGDCFVEGVVAKLEETKQKVFSPRNIEQLEQSGKIRVKLDRDDEDANGAKSGNTALKSVGVLKYVWSTKVSEQSMPFLLRMELEERAENENQQRVVATCTVTPHRSEGTLKELSITGTFNEGMAECVEHSEMDHMDFHWTKDVPEKFMWSIKKRSVEEECKLQATFGTASAGPKELRLQMQFEIENCGISDVRMVLDPDCNARIVKTVRSIRSGKIILK